MYQLNGKGSYHPNPSNSRKGKVDEDEADLRPTKKPLTESDFPRPSSSNIGQEDQQAANMMMQSIDDGNGQE